MEIYDKQGRLITFPGIHAASHASGGSDELLDNTAGGTDGEVTKAPTSNALYDVAQRLINKNAVINGCMRVAQQGTSFTSATTPANNDDTYLLDETILLSDGNDIVDVSQVVRSTPNGSYAEMKMEVETANKQFGFLKLLEARNAARFIGKTVSVQVKARMNAADDNTHSIKIAVLSWGGTADVVTSDVVNVWGATPTYVANWTAENTPASQTLTTTEQTFKVEGISIDTSGAKNIAVFVFCDQTDGAIDDAIIITDVQLELGSVATEFEFRPYELELELCQGTYIRMGGINFQCFGTGMCSSATRAFIFLPLPVQMRASPTLTFYSDQTKYYLLDTSHAGIASTALTADAVSPQSIMCYVDVAAGLTAGAMTELHDGATGATFISISARL